MCVRTITHLFFETKETTNETYVFGIKVILFFRNNKSHRIIEKGKNNTNENQSEFRVFGLSAHQYKLYATFGDVRILLH